jgi:hypothetical protein
VELHLSGLNRITKYPDMQKIRIIGFLFENRFHWQFEEKKRFLQTAVLGYILICLQIKYECIIPFVVLISGGKNLSHKRFIKLR